MQVKTKITDLKERLSDSIETWAEGRIDDFVTQNPNLKIASIYMKRGMRNYLAREKGRIDEMVDNAALFICDEEGNVDAKMLFDDFLTIFRGMEETPFAKGFIRGTIGKGVVRIQLPDNPAFNMLFGNTGGIKITETDLIELKNLFVE